MEDFEKLGLFYLGRAYDLGRKARQEQLVLYDSKDLVTHAVCVGMTGSGKTGLCLSLLEEALIDGIPAIAIDPKGDLANLLLTFPDLRPEDFAPWVNEGDAQRKGLTLEAYAAQQAELWKKGLAEWGQNGERIRRLRDGGRLRRLHPGQHGRAARLHPEVLRGPGRRDPPGRGAVPRAALHDRVEPARPGRRRRRSRCGAGSTSCVAKILEAAWKEGRDLDLAGLIHQVQTPPIARIGVLELEAFYPAKDRFELAMR